MRIFEGDQGYNEDKNEESEMKWKRLSKDRENKMREYISCINGCENHLSYVNHLKHIEDKRNQLGV